MLLLIVRVVQSISYQCTSDSAYSETSCSPTNGTAISTALLLVLVLLFDVAIVLIGTCIMLALRRNRRHGTAVAIVEGVWLSTGLIALRRSWTILALRWTLSIRSVGLAVLTLSMRRLVTTISSASGRRRQWILVLRRCRMLRHIPLSLTGSLVHVEEALALLIELLDPARRKLTAGLRWRRSRRRRGLSVGSRARLTIGTGLAIRLLMLRRVLLRRVWLLLVLSICVRRGRRRVLRLIDIACLLGLCTRKGQLL
jgi:hypothetical protein